jgi:hypothetical protein
MKIYVWTLLVFVVLVAMASGEERAKSICKTSHIGINAVAISCTNGADPTGNKFGNVLIISCGK